MDYRKKSAKPKGNRDTSHRLSQKGPEKKTQDNELTVSHAMSGFGGAMTSPNNFYQFHQGPLPAPGNDLDQRSGSKVNLKNIHARFMLAPVADVANPPDRDWETLLT